MNRNAEVHFMELPKVDIQRSVFDMSKDHMMSGNVGYLYPIFWELAMPGDTWKIKSSKVIRFQTMLTPTMGNISCDVHWYKVPLRLTYEHFEEFTGENKTSPWIPSVTYGMPTISAPSGGFAVGTIADHLGLPVGVNWNATDKNAPMALPFRAYALICNDFYRDENLTDPLNIPKGSSNQTGTNGSSYINDVANGGKPFKVAKYHDMWTSMLPGAQKANPVSISLVQSGIAPVITASQTHTDPQYALSWINANNGGVPATGKYHIFGVSDGSRMETEYASGATYSQTGPLAPNNLWADLTNATGNIMTINEFRLAFQLQKYYEKLARGGSRYTEQIREMFSVISPDARLQRPEYLGGSRIPIQVHQVANTAQTSTDFLGDVGALSVTADTNYDFETSCSEDCIIMGLMCIRYEHSYCQGVEPKWLKKDWLSFYKPVFANIGEQPYKKVSIYADGYMNSDDVFGYNEAWCEYRVLNNSVAGEMRPGVANSLASWHLADYYSSAPTLSDSWIREDLTNVDRVLAVQSSAADQFFADFYFDIKATRPMPVYSIPGLIDHH